MSSCEVGLGGLFALGPGGLLVVGKLGSSLTGKIDMRGLIEGHDGCRTTLPSSSTRQRPARHCTTWLAFHREGELEERWRQWRTSSR